MKQLLSIFIGVLIIVSLLVVGFTLLQVHQQQTALTDDLQRRTSLLADSFKEAIRPSYLNSATSSLQAVLDKFAGRERLLGLAIHDNKGGLFAASAGLPEDLLGDPVFEKVMDADRGDGDFMKLGGNQIYVFATPIHDGEKVIGSLSVFQRANYIRMEIDQIWKTNLLRLFLQLLLFSFAIILILNLIVYKPVLRLAEIIRQARNGNFGENFETQKRSGFLKPINAEVMKMARSLILARSTASEEAKMRLEELDSPWTAERLKEFFKTYLKDRKIFVVSNSEPYIHKKVNNKIVWQMPASGLVTGLEPIMEACGGTWLAHGVGDADRQTVDSDDKIKVPPDEPKYTLKRIWLTEKEIKEYYNGFSNEALWPLCILAHTRPLFRKQDWQTYCEVNEKFAQALLSEIKNVRRPIILVQDYHLALLPKILKTARPDAEVGLFWHIPWPNAEMFRICPWRKEIIKGMLGADILGFHTQQYCNNFLDTANKEIESIVDLEEFAIIYKNHTTHVKTFPLSVAFTNGGIKSSPQSFILEALKLKGRLLGVGVDRMDYAKGILEKFKGLEFFFNMYPRYKGEFTFVQIAPPSRSAIPKYRQFEEEVTREAERINKKFEKNGWRPIILLKEHHSHKEIYPLYSQARLCLISSLSDGMNLVAKEFIAAKNDDLGVLVISKFAGASRSLKGALVINPYSAEETARSIHEALTMAPSEQRSRMKKMRAAVRDYNVYRWAAEFLKSLTSLS